ncbi:hypothetical protein ACQSSU_12935 [Micromonospora echinospora]
MKCYLCPEKATVRVTVTALTRPPTSYLCCDGCEPRDIPDDPTVSIKITPL